MFIAKKKVALGAAVAVILGLSLGIGILNAPTSINLTTTTTVLTTTSASSTTRSATIESSSAVAIDPNLNVSLAQTFMLQTNATEAARDLASSLGQTLTGAPNVTTGYESTYYTFTTNTNSSIIVAASPGLTEVTYRTQNWDADEDTTVTNQSLTSSEGDAIAFHLMNLVGIPTSKMNFTDTLSYYGPSDYKIQLTQSYDGVSLLGLLSSNPDGSYFFSDTQVYFDFNTANGQLREVIFTNPFWYVIPSSFPLRVSTSNATSLAENYAINSLGMNEVSNTTVNFATIQDYLYYVVTVSNSTSSYQIFVNPSNGRVGLPTN